MSVDPVQSMPSSLPGPMPHPCSAQEKFTFESCDTYTRDAQLALMALGIVTRVLAYLALRYTPKKQY